MKVDVAYKEKIRDAKKIIDKIHLVGEWEMNNGSTKPKNDSSKSILRAFKKIDNQLY